VLEDDYGVTKVLLHWSNGRSIDIAYQKPL